MRCHQIQEGIEITAKYCHFLFHPFKNMDSHGGLFKGDVPTAIFSKRKPAPFHLPGTHLVSELRDQLVDHTEPGCAHRVPARLEPTRGVHGDLPAQFRGTALCKGAAFTHLAEPQRLALVQLSESSGVMNLCHIDVFRSY